MKGDFSRWNPGLDPRFAGVLQQQGRVLLDADWNEQTRITGEWQDKAAGDLIGSGVVAAPAETPYAFRVGLAHSVSNEKWIFFDPGRAWIDGRLVQFQGEVAVLTASDLGPAAPPPVQSGDRDLLLLEVWREELSAFQDTAALMETALGGVDTTARVQTCFALRLVRLPAPYSCVQPIPALAEPPDLGSLTVTLEADEPPDEECPPETLADYTGLEHLLYRVEIARVSAGLQDHFKWSRFNGGLVGRGNFFETTPEGNRCVRIQANLEAIRRCGLDAFYLEALEPKDQGTRWEVTYGARVELDGDLLVELEAGVFFESASLPSGDCFFRLWDHVDGIPVGAEEDYSLGDGIRLRFEPPPAPLRFRPGDYWTFAVRAGLPNPGTLLAQQQPQGIRYHRAPLAELLWQSGPDATILFAPNPRDLRRPIQPLALPGGCCSFSVGDGICTHGDFNSIELALNALPPWGGEICLLPGLHRAAVSIQGKFNIRIKGCGLRAIVCPGSEGPDLISIRGSNHISLEELALAKPGGTAIRVENSTQVEILRNQILAFRQGIVLEDCGGCRVDRNKVYMIDRPGGGVALYAKAKNSSIAHNDLIVIPAGTVPPEDVLPPGAEAEDLAGECLEDPDASDPQVFAGYLAMDAELVGLSEGAVHQFSAPGGLQIGGGSEGLKVGDNRIRGGYGNGITLGTDLQRAVGEEMDLEALVAEAPGDAEIPVIEHPGGAFYGYVFDADGAAVAGVAGVLLALAPTDRVQLLTAATDQSGFFWLLDLPAGSYRVFSASPAYRVTGLQTGADFGFNVPLIGVGRANKALTLTDVFAFAFDIRIARNEISDMGLSGIGTPQSSLVTLVALWALRPDILARQPALVLATVLAIRAGAVSGFLCRLELHRNRIHRCLQAAGGPIAEAAAVLSQVRGEGGISLGPCENLTIHRNEIRGNGRGHLAPTCGIFLSYGCQVEISRNEIEDNGPIQSEDVNLRPGIRGGLVIGMATSTLLAKQLAPRGTPAGVPLAAASNGVSAVNVHDNLINQPVGQALRVLANGPVSVEKNEFAVTVANNPYRQIPALAPMELAAGALLIINYGLPSYFRTLDDRFGQTDLTTPNGNILFSNNQTTLRVAANCFASQLLLTSDDLGFHANQSDISSQLGNALRINTVLVSPTLRASNNRLKEPIVVPS